MYPYGLSINPYPSSPTPSINNTLVIGGKKHKEARDIIFECIEDLKSKQEKDFRLITIIQDIGAGKTHLALHVKYTRKDIACSYVDLSTLYPRGLSNIYNSIIQGFGDEYVRELRSSMINKVKEYASMNVKAAKKFFRRSLFNRDIDRLAREVIEGKREPDLSYLPDIFKDYNGYELNLMKGIIRGDVNNVRVESLEEMLSNLSTIARFNLEFLNKVTVIEVDELDADKDAIDLTKAMINAKIRSTILIVITTPYLYNQIRDINPSLFDRLEKAHYKIDLAGSTTFDEVCDVVLEYIRVNRKDPLIFQHEEDLASKIKVIYDEFKEFRNIRSMLNIMYHAFELAKKKGSTTITEDIIDETITHIYPGLRVKGSIMDVPISDFIRISRDFKTGGLEEVIKNAIRNLIVFTHEQGKIIPEDLYGNDGLDIIYMDNLGKRVGVVININKDSTRINKVLESNYNYVDRLLVVTDTNSINTNSNVVRLDKCKIVDLIYFTTKYKEGFDRLDKEKVLMLARSLTIC